MSCQLGNGKEEQDGDGMITGNKMFNSRLHTRCQQLTESAKENQIMRLTQHEIDILDMVIDAQIMTASQIATEASKNYYVALSDQRAEVALDNDDMQILGRCNEEVSFWGAVGLYVTRGDRALKYEMLHPEQPKTQPATPSRS